MSNCLVDLFSPEVRKDLGGRSLAEQIATLQKNRLIAAALDAAVRSGHRLEPIERAFWDALVPAQAPAIERDNQLLMRLLSALADRGCSALLLKGAALGRWLYVRPELRPVTDMDLLVAPHQRLVAHEVMTGLGLESDGYSQHDLVGNQARYRDRVSGREVDLHWALHVLPEIACRFDFTELMARSIPVDGIPGCRALGRVDALMHAAVHYEAHQPVADRPLVWLYDLALLARGLTGAEWTELDQMVRSKQFAGLHAHALADARRWFEFEIPARMVSDWQVAGRRECSRNLIDASRGHVARVLRSLACLPSLKQRASYLRVCLFPPHDWMRGRYAVDSVTGMIAAYFRRWFSGAHELLGSAPDFGPGFGSARPERNS